MLPLPAQHSWSRPSVDITKSIQHINLMYWLYYPDRHSDAGIGARHEWHANINSVCVTTCKSNNPLSPSTACGFVIKNTLWAVTKTWVNKYGNKWKSYVWGHFTYHFYLSFFLWNYSLKYITLNMIIYIYIYIRVYVYYLCMVWLLYIKERSVWVPICDQTTTS